jgi:hypothetical protein
MGFDTLDWQLKQKIKCQIDKKESARIEYRISSFDDKKYNYRSNLYKMIMITIIAEFCYCSSKLQL